MKNKKLTKGIYFTDIHWGKKANSETHNEDCLHYIQWLCNSVTADPTIDYIAFLGDWHESRSALNIATLDYSYRGAKLLDDLGLPIFFVIGNHDLYHRHSREIHSVVPFNEFKNFTIVDQPTVIDQIDGGVLFSPFLFHHEYPVLSEYLKVPIWAGHFEFKGFVVTGYNITMPTGPDPSDFIGPTHIISGHFHKRQAQGQVVYIGNVFPMDFSDAGDNERGLMILNHSTNEMTFKNWEQCPKYIKTTLSDILDTSITIFPGARVKCVIDIPITFEESTFLRQKYIADYDLREFIMEESQQLTAVLENTEASVSLTDTQGLSSVNDLVMQMLGDINSEHINNQLLIDIYKNLKT